MQPDPENSHPDRTPPRRGATATMTTYGDLPAPRQGLILTHFLTRHDVAVSRDFYADVLGGEVVLEENPAIVKVANSWSSMNPGGRPPRTSPTSPLRHPSPGTRCRRSSTCGWPTSLLPPRGHRQGRPVPDRAAGPQGRTALLPARSRRLPGRGRAGHRHAGGRVRRPTGRQPALMRPGTRRAPVAARCEPDSSAEWASERGERITSASTSVVDASCVLGRGPAPPQPPAEPRRGTTDSSLSPWLVTP
jgi:hypothetical protein